MFMNSVYHTQTLTSRICTRRHIQKMIGEYFTHCPCSGLLYFLTKKSKTFQTNDVENTFE